MNRSISLRLAFGLALIAVAVTGCSKARTLGISASDAGDDAAEPGVVVTGPRKPSAIVAGAMASVSAPYGSRLGDVDGDGLDDFFVDGFQTLPNDAFALTSYLFYGRPEFPERLGMSAADAAFPQGQETGRTFVGDVNGDGLADLLLGYNDGGDIGYELVFGSRTRWSGPRELFSRGLKWQAPQLEPGIGVFWARELGDVDGDRCNEFVISFAEPAPKDEMNNPSVETIQTDFVIAGRTEGWPSGAWDPSWAVARLGDEPPVVENDGHTTVIQRLSFFGGGDFDGDGYSDILARGRTSLWIFYGGPDGLSGVLTRDRAAAELKWDFDGRKLDIEQAVPWIVGDVDGDGTTDLGLPGASSLGIVYGTKVRSSGTVMLAADLVIEADYSIWNASVGDVDGDTVPDLLLMIGRPPLWDRPDMNEIVGEVYRVSAAGQRATGRYVVSAADVFRSGNVELPHGATDTTFSMTVGGDVDGDGSDDLLLGADEIVDAASGAYGVVYLVPGTPRAPD